MIYIFTFSSAARVHHPAIYFILISITFFEPWKYKFDKAAGMLHSRHAKILDKSYLLLKTLSLPYAACYASCIKFLQTLAHKLEVKIFSIDTRVNLFSLTAMTVAKMGIFLSPLIPLGSIFINYGSKMCLKPWNGLKMKFMTCFLCGLFSFVIKKKS